MTATPVKILLVDDEPANRIALRALLAPASYQIVEASSGEEALRELLHDEFAVLLLDVYMPGMDGFELAELIHSREKTATMPIVFVTGHAADLELLFRGYRAGAADYLVKPLPPEIVRAKVAIFADLYRQRKEIESSLREKEVLLREIHHRVKNNLQIICSLLDLQAGHIGSEVQSELVEAGARVRSIALVHERLYQLESLASLNMDLYLHSLVSGLVQTYGAAHADVRVEDHGVLLPVDMALPCGLIFNELITNAIKHAFPGNRSGGIVAKIVDDQGQFHVEVRDNGVGMPADVDLEHPKRMGLQLVHSLTEQLHGQVIVDRSAGTRILVDFPSVRAIP